MTISIHHAEHRHGAFHDDVISVFRKHADHLSPIEILALMSHLIGQLIAVQDQREVTEEMVLEIVRKNMEQGHLDAVAELLGKPQGSA